MQGLSWRLTLWREEKGDGVSLPTGMFTAESDPLYSSPTSPKGHWLAGQGEARISLDSLHQTRLFPSQRQVIGWEPTPHHEVDQVPTAGGKEVWSQHGQKLNREGHLGCGNGFQERCRGGTGWD